MKTILYFLLTILLVSCVSVEIVGFTSPQYIANQEIKSIIIFYKDSTLVDVQTHENILKKELDKHYIQGVPYTSIIHPTSHLSEEETLSSLINTGADALIILETKKEEDSSYVPSQYHSGYSYQNYNSLGQITSSYTTPGYTTGGYEYTTYTLLTTISLLDLKNDRELIWKGEAKATYWDYEALYRETAEAIIFQLGKDRIIKYFLPEQQNF